MGDITVHYLLCSCKLFFVWLEFLFWFYFYEWHIHLPPSLSVHTEAVGSAPTFLTKQTKLNVHLFSSGAFNHITQSSPAVAMELRMFKVSTAERLQLRGKVELHCWNSSWATISHHSPLELHVLEPLTASHGEHQLLVSRSRMNNWSIFHGGGDGLA